MSGGLELKNIQEHHYLVALAYIKSGHMGDEDSNPKDRNILTDVGEILKNSQRQDGQKNTADGVDGNLLLLRTVNSYMNNHIKYIDDKSAHNKNEHFQTPEQTFKSGQGDCEDYALLKADLLRRAGVPSHQVSVMMLAPTQPNQSGHAVAIYTAEDGKKYVLDNDKNQTDPIPLDEYLEKNKFVATVEIREGEVIKLPLKEPGVSRQACAKPDDRPAGTICRKFNNTAINDPYWDADSFKPTREETYTPGLTEDYKGKKPAPFAHS
jgi:predicted transglutaminase-like cysteine proteinase